VINRSGGGRAGCSALNLGAGRFNGKQKQSRDFCRGDASMAANPQHEGDGLDGTDKDRISQEPSSISAELRTTANAIPAQVWYADRSGALAFVNSRIADYLGLPKDHPLRFGIHGDRQWKSHIPFLHSERSRRDA